MVSPLPLKSGALQGALALDYPLDQRFEALHIVYDGTNGQLPNLDLINSLVNIAGGQMGIQTAIQHIEDHANDYNDRLKTILRGMLHQGLGYATGPHSSFMPYHVDAITLQPYGEGWHDEMAMGRVVEGTFRSLNNLLEHLHQSFFFYLLMHRDRFVSIGTYLPSAMLLAANFSIMAIFLWVKSGQPTAEESKKSEKAAKSKKDDASQISTVTVERDLFLPVTVVAIAQSLCVVPLFLFNNLPAGVSTSHAMNWKYQILTSPLGTCTSFRCIFIGFRSSSIRCIASFGALQTHHAALPAHQVIFPSVPWHVIGDACHRQLLPCLHHRSALKSIHIRSSQQKPRH